MESPEYDVQESAVKLSRKDQAVQTRLLVFNTALSLLERKSFEDITVRDIVSEAGVSVGTFYNYFATKLDVFYETYVLADDYFRDTVAGRLTQADARERLLLYFDEYAAYSAEHSGLKLSRILYNSSNTRFLRSADHGMLPVLTQTLERARRDGQLLPECDPGDTAEQLMIAARGLVYDWCIHSGSYDLRAAMARYMERMTRWCLKEKS